MTFDK